MDPYFNAIKHRPYRQKHPHALLPADTDYAGEPLHGAGGVEYAGGGGLRDLQRGSGGGHDVRIFKWVNGWGEPAFFFIRNWTR